MITKSDFHCIFSYYRVPDFLMQIDTGLVVAGRGDGREGEDDERDDHVKDDLEQQKPVQNLECGNGPNLGAVLC